MEQKKVIPIRLALAMMQTADDVMDCNGMLPNEKAIIMTTACEIILATVLSADFDNIDTLSEMLSNSNDRVIDYINLLNKKP